MIDLKKNEKINSRPTGIISIENSLAQTDGHNETLDDQISGLVGRANAAEKNPDLKIILGGPS